MEKNQKKKYEEKICFKKVINLKTVNTARNVAQMYS